MRLAPLVLVGWVAGCSSVGELALDRVEPASGTNTELVAVRIEGENFRRPITSSLDDGATVVGDMQVLIGSAPLVGMVLRDDQQIEGFVPAGLPLGPYDVTVQLGDRTEVLVAGYTVTSSRVVPPPGPCGRPGVIADNFADDAPAPFWIVNGTGVVEQAGTLAVTPGTSSESGYRSDPYVDLNGGAAEIEVRTMLNSGTGATAFFRLSHGADELGFRVADGMLAVELETVLAQVAFDPVAHRNWRVAETGGSLSFETSPDGNAWVVLGTATAPSWIDHAQVSFGARNPAGHPDPGTVTFAEASTFVAPATWCPAIQLSDGFNDGLIGSEWAHHGRSSGGCAETESGSAAHADQNGTQACDAFYASSSLFDLGSSEMVVRITAITTFTPGWITYLQAADLTGQRVRFYFDQNQMCVDGTNLPRQCAAYNTNEDLWRIREDGGNVLFEVANSLNNNFRLVHSAPTPFSFAAIRPRFGTLTDRATGLSIGLSIDRFN